MCGIAGIAGAGSAALAAKIGPMLDCMAHRGPDGEGRFGSPSGLCLLGHRRLSVIDVTPASAQPMLSRDGRHALVYNGELYNFRELRARLQAEGVTFRTSGDAEVVLEALIRWGPVALSRFNGMFAIGFWEEGPGRLTLARDRFGQKPLYVARPAGHLVFASEIRAILRTGLVEPRLDRAGLAGFLRYGSVPGPVTIVEGIRSLEPGQILRWIPGKPEDLERFWSPGREKAARSAEELREILGRSVERHLVSDVPIGVFLSGGLDSAAIAALAARVPGPAVRTFTLVFPDEPSRGEAGEAGETARHVKTAHTEVEISATDIAGGLDAALRSQDQPSGDGFNTWLVARAARGAGMTVALSGLGADELFGGYGTFRDVPRMMRLRARAGPLSRLVSGAASLAASASPRRAGRLADLFRAPPGLIEAYLVRRQVLTSRQIGQLLPGSGTAEWSPGIEPRRLGRLSDAIARREPEDAVALLELDLYMGDTLLRDADAMGMAHALEIRVPFLDTEFSEAALALPAASRRPDPRPKARLAEAVGALLPPSLPDRPKRGFTLPLSDWMRGSLRPQVEEGLKALSRNGAPLDGRGVEALWADFLKRPAGIGWYRLWMLFVLGRYLDINGIRA